MKKIKIRIDYFKNNLPLVIYNLVFILIVLVNFPLDRYFYGWDGLYPELNYKVNFLRGLSASWQENYGLGTMAGHGFAATLPHTIIMSFLDIFLPRIALRPIFTFLCLYFGGLGIFVFGKYLLSKLIDKKKDLNLYKLREWICLIGSFYYVLNLGTVQIFAVQLEAFIVHFVVLPWLLWINAKLVEKENRKYYFYFFVISILTSIQGFIPPLFISYLMILGLFLFGIWVENKFSKEILMKIIKLLILTFLVNSYWLLPFIYYGLTNQEIYLNAYNNFISTPEFIEKSKKYGDLRNIIFLRSYFWESFQMGKYVFVDFIKHFKSILVNMFAYLFFGINLGGVIMGFKKKNWMIKGLSFAWLTIFSLLVTQTVPFSFLTKFLQFISPSFAQAFRIAFTKFGIGMSFLYSLFLVLGLYFILEFIGKYKKINFKIIFLTILFALIYYAKPVFTGSLFYKDLFLNIPNSYFEAINYFKDKKGRIAELPQYCSDGWYSTDWGYFGSGFLWYGLEEPLLSRSADVWSNVSENYYWEVSKALRKEDFDSFEKILDKYDVKWIIYDPSVLPCKSLGSFKDLSKLEKYLDNSDKYELELVEENLRIYSFRNSEKIQIANVSLLGNLPKIDNKYNFSWEDEFYINKGDYLSTNNGDEVYLFPSLFTNKGEKNLEFEVREDEDDLVIVSKSKKDDITDYNLNVPNIFEEEDLIPIRVNWIIKNKEINFNIKFLMPELYIGENKYIYDFDLNNKLSISQCGDANCYFNINYIDKINIDSNSGEFDTFLNTRGANIIGVYDGNSVGLFDYISLNLNGSELRSNYKEEVDNSNKSTKVIVPKIENNEFGLGKIDLKDFTNEIDNLKDSDWGYVNKEFDNNSWIYKSFNALAHDEIYLDRLDCEQSYILKIISQNISGIPFKFEVRTISNNRAEINTYLGEKKELGDNWLVLPKSDEFGNGYSFHFDIDSFDREVNENRLSSIEINWLPYNFLKKLKLVKKDYQGKETIFYDDFEVDKRAIWLYRLRLNGEILKQVQDDDNVVLKLSQAYHSGWLAFGKNENGKLKKLDHLKINNWANGWSLNRMQNVECRITEDCKQEGVIYIIFWPQILEYIGFGCLVGVFGWVLFKKK